MGSRESLPLGNGARTSAVRDHSDPRRFDVQQLLHLARGEGRDRNDQVGALGGGAGLRGEALAEIGSRIIARDYEQIVEGGDTAAVRGGAQTLVQSVKKIGGRPAILPEQTARGAARKTLGERAQEAV